MTLHIMRPAQVDECANLNTSRIGPAHRPDVRFPGGLATADIAKLLPRLLVYLPAHLPRNLPARVACVTGSGSGWGHDPPTAGVTVLVTDLAVIEFSTGSAGLRSVHPWASAHQVRAATGFELALAEPVAITQSPTERETMVMSRLDPHGVRAQELRRE
jgi:glutaconate CoA-transferase subunit B